ncbi:hypothetical protein MCAMS1_01190 [biofilm metagenome]
MKILATTSYYEINGKLSNKQNSSGEFEVTTVDTIDGLLNELKTDTYNAIVTEYYFNSHDVWQIANLVNSTHISPHALPIYLISETCDTEIPAPLAKAHKFKVVDTKDIGTTLTEDYKNNLETGCVRGTKTINKPSLLIIEDDEDSAIIAGEALKEGYEIDHAETGEAGLDLWQQKRHELIMLDYMLPGMKGNKVLKAIMEKDPDQPVIIVTAYDRIDRSKNMLLNGASEYLSKPYTPDRIRELCGNVLARARLLYQLHYADAKNDELRKKLWALDNALNHDQFERAKEIMSRIKLTVPVKVTDDELADMSDWEE